MEGGEVAAWIVYAAMAEPELAWEKPDPRYYLRAEPLSAGVGACVHSWRDFGSLGGRAVVWCQKCDALAFAGNEDRTCGVLGIHEGQKP
jgi:hypothetical protein